MSSYSANFIIRCKNIMHSIVLDKAKYVVVIKLELYSRELDDFVKSFISTFRVSIAMPVYITTTVKPRGLNKLNFVRFHY